MDRRLPAGSIGIRKRTLAMCCKALFSRNTMHEARTGTFPSTSTSFLLPPSSITWQIERRPRGVCVHCVNSCKAISNFASCVLVVVRWTHDATLQGTITLKGREGIHQCNQHAILAWHCRATCKAASLTSSSAPSLSLQPSDCWHRLQYLPFLVTSTRTGG